MLKPRLGAPFSVVLPSGARIEVRARASDARDLAQALELGAVKVSVDPYALPLADANVLEAIVATLGAVATAPVPIRCRNCGEDVEVDAAAALPVLPLLAPPGDPELDPKVDDERWYAFDAPLEVAHRGPCDRFRLARRTLRDRVRLEELLGDDERAPLPIGAPMIRALGLSALGRGDEIVVESPMAIGRALLALDDDAFDRAWDRIVAAWDEQHWPPRLLSPTSCPRCGARHDVELLSRPLALAPLRAHGSAFPSLDEFTRKADALTRELMGDRELGDLVVVVEDGVPPCDDGGEPLLGSYTPDVAPGDGRVHGPSFVVALYYRTFASMWTEEPYDVDDEIRETIAHELEHHEGFLRGEDPLDDDERAAIVREHRRLQGLDERRVLPAAAGWLATDFVGFLRRTWPVWLVVLLLLWLTIAGRP